MQNSIGIRREDKNKWERRTPITPSHVKYFKEQYHIQTTIQPSSIRVFTDEQYEDAGAVIQEDVSDCPIIFAIKEIPTSFFQSDTTYAFFSHTIKGQSYNMPMLKRMMDLHCTLIDYEKITDARGMRLVFFGRYAGLAGMLDTLWAFGQRLAENNISSPFKKLKQTIQYQSLSKITHQLSGIGHEITHHGLPKEITPRYYE